MSFDTSVTIDFKSIQAGEPLGDNNIILGGTSFEDGLIPGRFAKLDSGQIDNLDSSGTPVIAGVPLRKVSDAVEKAGLHDTELKQDIEYLRAGLVTVDVVSADSPAQFGTVYAKNTDDADRGKATTVDDATTEATGAEFIEEIATDVWLVRLV